METWMIALIVLVVLVVIVAAVLVTRSRKPKHDRQLEERFGPEYEREVERTGSRETAESRLRERLDRHEQLDITALSDEQRERYVARWRDVQRRFVDAPEATLGEADRLITEAMRDRGYPTEHFEQKVADLSVEHARALDSYREAHAIADRHERGEVSTDELRQAMQHFRKVFEAVVEARPATRTGE